MSSAYGPEIAVLMGGFSLVYLILSAYGLLFVLAYRWIKHYLWVSTAAWLTGVTVGFLGIALAIAGVFVGRGPNAGVFSAAIAICGILTFFAALVSRRLSQPRADDSDVARGSSFLRIVRVAGLLISWMGHLLVVCSALYILSIATGKVTGGVSGVPLGLALSLVLPIYGFGGVLRSMADSGLRERQ